MNQTHLKSSGAECRQVLLSSALAIAMIAGLSCLLALIINHFFQLTSPLDLSDFSEFAVKYILPEPTERMVFQIMVFLSPAIALIAHLAVKKLSPSLGSSLFFGKWGYLLVAIFMAAWVNSWAFWPNYMISCGLGSFSIILPVVTGLLLFLYAYGHTAPFQWFDALIRKRFGLILPLVLVSCLLIAVSYRIFDWKILLKHVNNVILHHINPVLYYISLAETRNYSTSFGAPQYGFYSLYLKPAFNLLGLTIYSFSLVMTILYLIGVLAIAMPVFRYLKNQYLKLLLIPVLCALQGSLGQVFLNWDPYFQYYPIRFLVPALSVLMLYLTLRTEKENIRLYIAAPCSFLLGFLVFWNLDSGITTVIAWTGFFLLLATIETVKRRAFNPALYLFLAVVTLLAIGVVVAGVVLSSCDKSGISLGKLFESQRIFYLRGLNMLPMPLSPHPWMAVLGVYVATLVLTLPCILQNGIQSSRKRMFALYIAIIGMGLFSYYQGRSHDCVLTAVVWPAVICCFLSCDWCLSANSTKQLAAIRFLTLPFMALAVSLSVKLAWDSPWYLNKIIFLQREFSTTESNSIKMPVSYVIDWISGYRNEPPDSVLIIHPAESVFYVESGLHPSHLLPSEQERFMFRRQDADMQKVIQSGTLKHLLICPISIQTQEYKSLGETIHSLYKLEESSLLEHWTLKEKLSK